MVLQIYTWCWTNAANSSHRESSEARLLAINICSLQHIWMSCVLSSPSLFQPLKHCSNDSASIFILAISFFSKNLHRTLWSPTWFECQRGGTVIREQHRFETSYTQKSGFLINWIKVQMLLYALLTYADVKKHHHLCSGRPFILILFIKFSLCFDGETRPRKFSLYNQ